MQDENKIVFFGFYGGYNRLSHYIYINAIEDGYLFKYRLSVDGKIIKNYSSMLQESIETEKNFLILLEKIKTITANWKHNYDNPDVLDGIQWNIDSKDYFGSYSGSNAYPENFNELIDVLKEYFDIK